MKLHTKTLLTALTATAALAAGSASAATVNLNDIFKTTSLTTSYDFNDGSNIVTIDTSYETGGLFSSSSSEATFNHSAVGLDASNTNETTITFDLPVNLSMTFSSLNLGREFFAYNVNETSITLDPQHQKLTSGTGSISGFTMIRNPNFTSITETSGTVVTWSNITSLTLLNGRNAGSTPQAQIISAFDVTVVPEPGSLALLGLGGLLIAPRRRRGA